MPVIAIAIASCPRRLALLAAGLCALICVQSLSAQTVVRDAGRSGDALHASATTTAHPRELFLAGGALKLCSSLAAKDCTPAAAAVVAGAHARGAARYGLDAAIAGETFETALDPALWRGREAMVALLRALLADARGKFAANAVDEDALRAHLESRCVGERRQVRNCRGTARSPWLRLDDEEQSAVLAALERPQRDAQGRKREYAALAGGRRPYGAEILRAFVVAARERVPGDSSADGSARRPRIAVVTASAYDPFDPVDMYLDALHQAGAEVEWWPVDAAVAAAVFEGQGCGALTALRLSRLKLPGRERVYPDLAAQQAQACARPDSLRTLPDRVQGVFFTGGDQWKLRRAFFGNDQKPNAWLLALRAAVARGDVVIGGTSAGSAVQSGGPMLSNGTPESALRHGTFAALPPVPGCGRAGNCRAGLDEDAFTYLHDGGLGMAPGFIVDTHFSERAREVRLLRLLVDTCTRFGVGVDETSALRMRWSRDGRLEIAALGASGGWVFDAAQDCGESDYAANVYYLAPGPSLWLQPELPPTLPKRSKLAEQSGTDMLPPLREPMPKEPTLTKPRAAPRAMPGGSPQDALADGALRAVARALAADREDAAGYALRAGDTGYCVVLRPLVSAEAPQMSETLATGIRPMRIETAAWPDCMR